MKMVTNGSKIKPKHNYHFRDIPKATPGSLQCILLMFTSGPS